MRTKCDILNNHSRDVGRIIYDKSAPMIRAEFVAHRDAVENPEKSPELCTEFEKEMEDEMENLEREDRQVRERNARAFLQAEKSKRSHGNVVGPRVRVTQEDRIFLQQFVFEEVYASEYGDFEKGEF